MIKQALATLFFINSCSYISYTEILPIVRSTVMGADDIEITKSYIANREFSFAKFKLGRSSVAILSLAFIKDDVFEWVSSSNERIFTLNGKIIRTIGLPHNIEILDRDLDKSFSNKTLLVSLDNPTATVSQSLTYNSKLVNGSLEVSEEVTFNELDISFINEYLIEESTGRAISSTQKIHPRLSKISINFYYK